MLVLSRKIDEAIWLGDDIQIKVMGIENGVVKLGIDAPKNVSILRQELKDEVASSNIAASSSQESLSELQELMHKIKK